MESDRCHILIVWAVFFLLIQVVTILGKKASVDNSKVVRKISSFKITEARVEQEITNMRRYGYVAPEGSSQEALIFFFSLKTNFREQAISNLTDFFLVLTYAERNNLNKITEEQIDERINAVLSQSQVSLEIYLEEGKISEGEFRKQVEHQLVFERVLDPLSAKVPEPSDAELKSHFDQNRQTYVMPEAVEYQQLMVPDMASCKKAIGFLNSGKSFADVVNDFSQNDAVREAGGLMPIMTKSDIPIQEIANALFPPYEGYPGSAKSVNRYM
ncbi:MAG: SurA N-terminal domain-containing protein [Caldisericia bacterium]